MRPIRRRRLGLILFGMAGLAIILGMTLAALRQNIDHFHPPERIVQGDAPTGVRIRAGGYVESGSVVHETQGLGVAFRLTDHAGSSFPVRFEGLLPALFEEGQGSIVIGKLEEDGTFVATEVLAKHDENYVPPELKEMARKP